MVHFLYEIFFCILFISNANANPKHGFTVDLIHRNSPRSPFYNSAETSSQRINNAIRRSVLSVLKFNNDNVSQNTPQSTIISNRGEYLMNISIGTPASPILAIADTGSDLIWTQCKPCLHCFKHEAPLFDPKKSSTYKKVPCSASQCKTLEESTCTKQGTCYYSMAYGDQSYTNGDFSNDILTLGSTNDRPLSFKNVNFGCGLNNDGTFDPKGSGIIGLGRGSISLVSQLGKSIDGKFSYCLVPLTSETGLTSKINFGSNGVVSGKGVVTTPIVTKVQKPTFYFLTLESISVGNKNIQFFGSPVGTKDGNIIIDSGTTLTLLPTGFYNAFESAVASTIKAKRVKDPQGVLSLCYNDSSLKVPDITVHFKSADLKLEKMNTFVPVSEDLYCFAFAANDHLALYGNVAQMNFLVGYDTISKTVSFKPSDCSKM